jgi:hypothetical protein
MQGHSTSERHLTGENASTACKPGERGDRNHSHTDSELESQTAGLRQGTTTGGTLVFWEESVLRTRKG